MLYSTKSWCFSGFSVVLHQFFGMTEGYIAPLPYTETLKFLYGSSAVLQWLFGVIKVLYSTARPDIAELDVFLGQHILLTLEQHFNPKI